MYNQNKRTAISDFTEKLSAAYHLDNSSFSDLYYWHYFDLSAALKKEIMENLNSLSPARFNAYIKYVKNEIHEVYGYYDPNECIIGKWIEKFDLIEEDFPFDDNGEVKRLLSVNRENYESESEKEEINIRLMQLEFHWYAGHLEYLKMKRFIDELLEPEIIKQQSKVPVEEIFVNDTKVNNDSKKPVNPYPRIFTSYEAFSFFEKLRAEFGNTNTNLKNYSFIFRRMLSDSLIFSNLKHTEFIEFLMKFDIDIERINTLNDIGNKKHKEHIYSSLKT